MEDHYIHEFPQLAVTLLECAEQLEKIALPRWRFWRMSEMASAHFYSQSILELVKEGKLSSLENLMDVIHQPPIDKVSHWLAGELTKMLEGESQ